MLPAGGVRRLEAAQSLAGAGILPRREVNDTVHIQNLLTAVARHSSDDDRGQGLAEYALILGLIAVVSIIALLFLGNGISGALSTVGDAM
jgi:Flp pilus assembly pilin Flp